MAVSVLRKISKLTGLNIYVFLSDLNSAISYAHAVSSMIKLPSASTCTRQAGGTTVVVSYCVMIAGPVSMWPGLRAERSKIGVSCVTGPCALAKMTDLFMDGSMMVSV